MLNSEIVDAIIYRAIASLNAEREPWDQIPMSPETSLFGVDAALDSLSFVSLITDVEASLNLEHNQEISLADDRAMARVQSPYATVKTLRDYIMELVAET